MIGYLRKTKTLDSRERNSSASQILAINRFPPSLHSAKETDRPPELLFPAEEVESLGRSDDERESGDEEDL